MKVQDAFWLIMHAFYTFGAAGHDIAFNAVGACRVFALVAFSYNA